ncbi:MAG: glycine--tRNA ligase subunit beta [Lysobacteraceae bacterium]
MSQQTLLIELGTEELPVKALPGLAQALTDGVVAALDSRGIEHGGARTLQSPRRLAVQVANVATTQPEQHSEMLGPYLNIALDADGNPTKALQGFASKCGVEWSELDKVTDQKGERFAFRSVTPGANTIDLLGEVLAEAVKSLPIPKPMRWGDRDHGFARPLHWLVVLLGEDIAEAELFGFKADRMSRGHRFHHDKPVWLSSADDYLESLRAAHVLVDPDERRQRIIDAVNASAAEVNGRARIDDDNLEQVNCLNEWPVAVRCQFEREFLAVPQEALISTMETNQKFFPVLDADGKLTEHFIGIANIESKDPAEIAKGYERVIRPRFADAKFFYDEDLKQGLASMNDGLKTVTYQAKLGSYADKVARIAALAEAIAGEVGVDPVQARAAAELCKADLQSRMVNEFPELQGIAGRYYAAAEGEPAEVANAIDESWMPRFAADDIAPSRLGQVLAIAERLDTLAGGFAAGLEPTGNKDPFALRRNALGLARTIVEGGIDLHLYEALEIAHDLAQHGITQEKVAEKLKARSEARAKGVDVSGSGAFATTRSSSADVIRVHEFILDRLRGYYADRGFTPQQFAAVAELKPASLLDFDARLKAVAEFAKLPEAEALAAANKRIRNILRKAEDTIPESVDAALLAEDAEKALATAVDQAIADSDPLLARRDYVAALSRLAQLREPVDAFFDGVMVMAEDNAVRGNRLALLKRLADRFAAIAAIEHLSG